MAKQKTKTEKIFSAVSLSLLLICLSLRWLLGKFGIMQVFCDLTLASCILALIPISPRLKKLIVIFTCIICAGAVAMIFLPMEEQWLQALITTCLVGTAFLIIYKYHIDELCFDQAYLHRNMNEDGAEMLFGHIRNFAIMLELFLMAVFFCCVGAGYRIATLVLFAPACFLYVSLLFRLHGVTEEDSDDDPWKPKRKKRGKYHTRMIKTYNGGFVAELPADGYPGANDAPQSQSSQEAIPIVSDPSSVQAAKSMAADLMVDKGYADDIPVADDVSLRSEPSLLVYEEVYRKFEVRESDLVNDRELERRVRESLDDGEVPYLKLDVDKFPKYLAYGNIEQKRLYEKLWAYIELSRPFLNPNVNVCDVATALGTNRTYLSRVINQTMRTTFTRLMNVCRVHYAVEYFKKDPSVSVTALSAIAGFNRCDSCAMSFNVYLGCTTKEWCRRYREYECFLKLMNEQSASGGNGVNGQG